MAEYFDGGNARSFATSYKWRFLDYFNSLPQELVFFNTGAMEEFVVPDGVTKLSLYLVGGNGGSFSALGGGYGGRVYGTLAVTPGESIYITVGGNGAASTTISGAAGGFNGGGDGGDGNNFSGDTNLGGCGGGGATDVRRGGRDLAHRVAVAAGGGGQGNRAHDDQSKKGGAGGPETGAAAPGTYGGQGGTQAAGGVGQRNSTENGSLGQGGDARSAGHGSGAGGGGAGYYGGAAGGYVPSTGIQDELTNHAAYGGGGGSNFGGGLLQGVRSLRGDNTRSKIDPKVRITYTAAPDEYVWEINPNDGGSPDMEKQISVSQNVGPNRLNLLQEGQSSTPTISFSGVIISQKQYETLEQWFDRRILIKLTDDLGRDFYGVFSKFTPKRARRAHTPWYHTYDASFTVSAYVQASGQIVYGRLPDALIRGAK